MLHKIIQSPHIKRLYNMGLRSGTLVCKLGLTLYMGKYLNLNEIGVYGLVFGIMMSVGCVLGFRFDYVVSREIVGTTPEVALQKMRDQAAFFIINYGIMAVIIGLLIMTGVTGVDSRILLYILILMVTDNFANTTYNNMNSMGQPLLATSLFFIRSGAWVLPVVGLGMISPRFRNVDTIFIAWIAGIIISILLTLYVWRNLPWSVVWKNSVDWAWIKDGVKRCFLVWLGGLGLAAGVYLDRFVVMHFLGLDEVGIATFYFSFANAILTLIQSGVLAIAYPRLITFYRNNNLRDFTIEVKQTTLHITIYATIIALCVGFGVPLLGKIFHKDEYVKYAFTLWLMLGGIWLRSHAETMYFILFARHQDRAIWLGNLLFLVPALGGNLILVPMFGLSGIGYSSILAAIFLLVWRSWYVAYPGGTVRPADTDEVITEGEESAI